MSSLNNDPAGFPEDTYSPGAHCYQLITDKVIAMADRLSRDYGITCFISVEQELNTLVKKEIDFEAVKKEMGVEAEKELITGNTERAKNILDALPLATTAEHLFNIAVYAAMHGELEHRDSPEIHGVGYYDEPGNLEFRIPPQKNPADVIDLDEKLTDTLIREAGRFGLTIKWRGEQTNISVWKDGHNITSVATGYDNDLAGRILAGMMDTNEDVRPLLPGQPAFGKEVSGGPTRLDIIRIVNQSEDSGQHRFEQRNDLSYSIMMNMPFNLLMLYDGILRGVTNPEYAEIVRPIRTLWLVPVERDSIKALKLDQTFRTLNRLELGPDGRATNIDDLFARKDTLFWFVPGTMGEKITKELLGDNAGPEGETVLRNYFKAIVFAPAGIIWPREEGLFQALSARLGKMEFKEIRLFDSLKCAHTFVPDQATSDARTAALRERWGNTIVEGVSGVLLKKRYADGRPNPPIFRKDYIFGGLGI